MHLFFGLRMADVHDVQQQIGLDDFFERGLEGFNQPVRQFADEPHGVGQQHVLIGRQPQPPRCRIERGEEFVLRQDLRAGEPLSSVDLPALV